MVRFCGEVKRKEEERKGEERGVENKCVINEEEESIAKEGGKMHNGKKKSEVVKLSGGEKSGKNLRLKRGKNGYE